MFTLIQTIILIMVASNVYALEVFIDAKIVGTNRLIVSGQTNLPDTTKVMITVSNDELGYQEQVGAEVSAGIFESGPFEDIRPGTYTVNISLGAAQFQNGSVRSVIGSRGEKLQGTLVIKGMLGKTVRYSTKFAVI